MNDIVIGNITGYDFDKIKPWVNSLDTCGFTGTKLMICYDIDFDTVEELVKRNYSILTFAKDEAKRRYVYKKEYSIVVERFFIMWKLLKRLKGQYRYLVSTDVKDVIFQTNPSTWLENNIGDKKINVACESIRYRDEDWGNNNILKSFGPHVREHMQDEPIYNAGTLSGEFDTMIDFFHNVYLLCNGAPHLIEGGGGPDQAAVNVLLNMLPYKDITNFAMSEDGYAAQLGTTGPQVANKFAEKLIEKSPILVNDLICTSKGVPFSIVHQYDRVPDWKKIVEKKYE